jgi:hyperosmotically inducible periplasmic protein
MRAGDPLSYANSVPHVPWRGRLLPVRESQDAHFLRRKRMKLSSIWPLIRRAGFCAALLVANAGMLAGQQSAPTKKPASSAPESPGASLSHEIRHQILVLPFYSVFDSINFTLDGHRVTLTGQVLRRSLKEHAEAAVKSIEGVAVVVNQIEVLPVSPSDDDLRDAVYRAIYEDSTLERYAIQSIPPVHIIVKNGAVTLEGAVDTPSDKNLAAARAGSAAKGVSIKNDLLVHAPGSAAE